MRRCLVAASLGVILAVPLAAQSPPPIQGTLALKGTVTKFYRGLNALVVTTVDGAQHVYHLTGSLLVHGSKGAGPNDLAGLRAGTSVVVHYRINGGEELAEEIDQLGDQGLKIEEGIITKIDRDHREIELKLADGKTETLRLTDRAASEFGAEIKANGSTVVTVYYTDESGYRLAHYFRTTP